MMSANQAQYIRSSRQTLADRHTHFRYWAENWAKIAWLGIKNNPVRMLSDMKRYQWLSRLLNANKLLDTMVHTRTGLYKQANAIVVSNIVSSISIRRK